MFIYRDEEIPEGTICTQRLNAMLQFSEYKRFLYKCKVYCENRNINIDQYIDDPKYLAPYNTRVYFLPIDLALGIVENVRMSNPNRGATLEYLYKLKGEKIHVQLQPRKADDFVNTLQQILHKFGIKAIAEYAVLQGKYRIDLYVPQYKLAIEYDEEHHTLDKDSDRQAEIEELLNCTFIRISNTDTYHKQVSDVLVKCLKCI